MGFRGKPHFVVAVRRQLEDRTWILRGSVDPGRFDRFVRRSFLLDNAEAFVVNADGERQTFSGDRIPETEPSPVLPRSPETEVSQVRIAVVYDRYLKHIIPDHWFKAGEWRIQNNVICGDDKVTFYASDELQNNLLVQNLRHFSDQLPESVIQSGAYIED